MRGRMSRTEEGKKEEKAFKRYSCNSFCPFMSVLIFVCFENIGYQTDKKPFLVFFVFFCFLFGFLNVFLKGFFCFFPFFPPPPFFLFFFFCFFCFVCFLFFSKNYLYHNKK